MTGATRGIGAEIVKQLTANSSNTVIATVRDIKNDAAQKLISSAKNLIVVQIDGERDEDPATAAKKVSAEGIKAIDVVIANAGVATDFEKAVNVKTKDFRKSFSVNVVAPLLLFQAFRPLLENSSNPRFIGVSSGIASLAWQKNMPFTSTTYGGSKAALNFVIVRLAIEQPKIISFILHPGLVVTEMSTVAHASLGKNVRESGDAITPEASAKIIIGLADGATAEASGKFFNAPNGEEIPW